MINVSSAYEAHKTNLPISLPKVFFYLSLLLLGAALIRLDFLLTTDFRIESDEAIVGLMAKRWLEGASMPIFYYGQHYMGSFEPILVGLMFMLTGVSTVALKIVPYFCSLLLLPALYYLTRQVSSRRAGLLAALLYAFSPAVMIIWSSKPRGGFIELLLIGTLSFIFFIKWWQNAQLKALIISALLLGFGWWVNNQIIYYLLPISWYVLTYLISGKNTSFRKRCTDLLAAIASFFVGSFLYWLYNFNENFASLAMFTQSADKTDLWSNFKGLVTIALPVILGSIRPWQSESWLPGLNIIVFAILITLALTWFVWRLDSLRKLLIFRADRNCLQELLAMHAFCVPMIFALSSFGSFSAEPRYLLPLYTSLIPLYAIVLDHFFIKRRVLARFLLAVILLINLGSCYFMGRATPGEPYVYSYQRASKDHSELLTWLKSKNYQAVKTNYWIGYRLAFESNESVRFALFDQPNQLRIESYEEFVLAQPESSVPLILVPGQAALVVQALKVLGYKYRAINLSNYVVIYELRRPDLANTSALLPEALRLSASSANTTLNQAVDGDLKTRWGSASPQHKEMFVQIDFVQPVELEAIEYNLGEWVHDYPRGLKITANFVDGSSLELLGDRGYRALWYFLSGTRKFTLKTKLRAVSSVRFQQTESDPIFDWSIAELKFYGQPSLSKE
jgi:4-amino-4-deoxy-L-arabinose transferase-like glycosyltransferase